MQMSWKKYTLETQNHENPEQLQSLHAVPV